MKTEIQIFNNPQFGEIRIIADVNNEPLFCAADVCKALGYSNPRDAIAKHVDKEDVAKRDAWVETGKKADGTTAIRKTKMSFVNESGLYSLIFGSKLESAKSFKRWVTSEILPSIRKHGAYATPTTIESIIANPETGIKLLMALKEEREARLEAEKKNEENAPKVLFADAVIGSESSCLIGELAKILTQNGFKIGQNRLFKTLREEGYLGSKGEYYNVPTQRYQEMGLFTVKKGVRSGNEGVLHTTLTTKVTGKGQQYFINKFLSAE